MDTVSGQTVGFAFYAEMGPTGQVSGRLAARGPAGTTLGAAVNAASLSANEDYDYALGIVAAGYTLWVACSRENDRGTVLLENGTVTVGPVQVTDGSVHCYDVPYVNW